MALLAGVMSWLCIAPAHAQQPISGNYAAGAFTGMKGAIQPPSGKLVLENGTLLYNTKDFVDSDGNSRRTDTVNAAANRTIIGYVTDFKLFGGDYFPAIIVPFANVALRPEPGSKKDFQLGDLILQPLALGWHHGSWHSQVAYNLWLPTGRFNEGASNNVGKGLYSHLFTGGITWLQDAKNPWAATLMLRYEILGKQRDTNIEPGDVLIVEGGVGKEIIPGLDLGLTGYHMRQASREKGSAAGTDTSLYRASALGPEINWRPSSVPGLQLALRSYFEFDARNSSEGVFTVISIAYLFP
jgi:hypothetical protein